MVYFQTGYGMYGMYAVLTYQQQMRSVVLQQHRISLELPKDILSGSPVTRNELLLYDDMFSLVLRLPCEINKCYVNNTQAKARHIAKLTL